MICSITARSRGLIYAATLALALVLCSAQAASADTTVDRAVRTAGNLSGPCTIGYGAAPEVRTEAKMDYDAHLYPNRYTNIDLEISSKVDPGIATARDAYPIHFGRQASCAELNAATNKDPEVVLRGIACRSDASNRPAKWCALGAAARTSAPTDKPYIHCVGNSEIGMPVAGPGSRFMWTQLATFLRKEDMPYLTALLGITMPVYFDDLIVEVGMSTPYNGPHTPGTGESQIKIVRAAVVEAWINWLESMSAKIGGGVGRGEVIKYILGHKARVIGGQTLIAQYRAVSTWFCALTPWSQDVIDPNRTLTNNEVDLTMRALFDKLAKKRVGYDVLCNEFQICGAGTGTLAVLLRAVWGGTDHGRPLVKQFIGKLVP